MFDTTEYNERMAGRQEPGLLSMPLQAPPVDRTRTVAAYADTSSGVEASGFNLGDILKTVATTLPMFL